MITKVCRLTSAISLVQNTFLSKFAPNWMTLSKQFLIFISRDFPYGFREPYIENEIVEFSQHYHKVFLMVPYAGEDRKKGHIRNLPENVMVIQFSTNRGFLSRLSDLLLVFTRLFWRELIFQQKEHHVIFNRQRFRDMLGYLGSGVYFKKILTRFLKRNHIPFRKTTFYSYHLCHNASRLCFIQRSVSGWRDQRA